MKKVGHMLLFLAIILVLANLTPQTTLSSTTSSNHESETLNNSGEAKMSSKSNWCITLWNKTYGGPNDDCAYSIILDSHGGYVVAGYTYSFGAGDCDTWLLKIDTNGNIQWNRTYGGPGHDEAHSLIQTNDGGFIIAGTTNSFGSGGFDAWLIKTDPSGNMLWNKTYGGSGNDDVWHVIATADGGFAIAGWTTSFGSGAGDFWLIKTDSNGNIQWSKTYGGVYFDAATCVRQTLDGGFILSGYTYSYGAGGADFWLIKTDNQGNVQWNKTYGGSDDDYAFSCIQTFDGGYAITGSTSSYGAGVYDFWIVKTDPLGNRLWNKTYGGLGYDEAWSIIQITNTKLAIIGWTETISTGNTDCQLLIIDSQGEILWSQTLGGKNNDYAYSFVTEMIGLYVVCGQTISSTGDSDILLVKIWASIGGVSRGGMGSRMPLLR